MSQQKSRLVEGFFPNKMRFEQFYWFYFSETFYISYDMAILNPFSLKVHSFYAENLIFADIKTETL
jgi:hypothetical protein